LVISITINEFSASKNAERTNIKNNIFANYYQSTTGDHDANHAQRDFFRILPDSR